jgi:hypothetical protein
MVELGMPFSYFFLLIPDKALRIPGNPSLAPIVAQELLADSKNTPVDPLALPQPF